MKLQKLVVGVLGLGLAGSVLAADGDSIKVQAAVIGTCKINVANDINFGQLDPSQASNASANGSVVFACTKNVDYTMTAGNGAHWDTASGKRRMKGEDTNFLPYSLAQSSFTGKGLGFSNPVTVSINASILGVDYKDLPVDSYMDTLQLAINP